LPKPRCALKALHAVQKPINGQYTIKASKGETLVFSFLGYKDKSAKVGGNPVLNVKLTETVGIVNEVVVKDLHVKREQDALGYTSKNNCSRVIIAVTHPA
jgi:hypothetical protein